MLDVSVTLDGWTANSGARVAGSPDGCLWYLEGIDGWSGSSGAVRSNLVARSSQDGLRGAVPRLGGRVITLAGSVIAPDDIVLSDVMDNFGTILVTRLRRDWLTVDEHYSGKRRAAMVEHNSDAIISRVGTGEARWSFSLLAPDPTRYSAVPTVVTTTRFTTGNGKQFPWVFPVNFGSGSGAGLISVNNVGNTITYPVIKLAGPLTDPSIRLVGGEALTLLTIIEAGQEVVIDTFARTVTLGISSQRTRLTFDSKWFYLPKGTSALHFSAGDGTGTCSVEYRSAWS